MYNDQNSKQIAIGMLIANLRATLKDKVNSHQLAVYESWATNVDDMRHHESYCEVSRFFDGIIFIICYVLTFISVQVLIDKEEEGISRVERRKCCRTESGRFSLCLSP